VHRAPLTSDLSLALLAAVAVLTVYLRTLLPDLGGYEDTPKFQYLGAMLGTAHRPGYPLYVLLSHLFSYIPIGNVAYRADLLSAVAGSAAVAHVFLIARALGFHRAAAWFGAVGLGAGSAFWNYAVLAEVYTLAAFLLIAVLYWMVRWGQSGRPAHLYAASAFFALALGNHLSIGMAGPAIALFLAVSPARRTLTPRRVATAGLIVASGFLQYLYVLIRTRQGAAWVEANAGSVPQLLDLLKADTYNEFVLPFTWQNLTSVYLPSLGQFARLEYGVIGLTLVAAGVVWAFRRDWRSAALLAASGIGTLGLVLHLFGDMRGFLVPVWVIVGVFLAAGADAVQRAAARLPGQLWAGVAAIALVGYPAWPLAANFTANDWSQRTDEARFLRAVVDTLPAPAALVREDYVLDSMLNYLEAIERHPVWAEVVKPQADPTAIAPLFERGVPVFAFDRAYAVLVPMGFDFDRVRVPSQSLAGRVRELPAGSVVAIAARETWLPIDLIDALGLDATVATAAPRPYQALVATIGATPSLVQHSDAASAIAEPSASTPALRHRVEAVASAEGVRLMLGDQIMEAAAGGMLVLIVDARHGSVESYAPAPPDFRIARQASHSLYRLTGRLPVLEAGNDTWTDVTSVAADGWLNVTVNNFEAFDARTTAYAVAKAPLGPAIDSRFRLGPEPTIDVRVFDRDVAEDRADLAAALAADGLSADRVAGGRYVARMHQTVNDQGDWSSWGLALGAVPTRVWLRGTTDLPSARRVTASPLPVNRYLEDETVSLINASGAYDWVFGRGWLRPERSDTGEFRWTTEREARMVLPIAGGSDISLTLSVLGRITARDPAPSLAVAINGVDLGPCALEAGWKLCTWHAPASAVLDGANEVVVRSSSVGRPADEGGASDDTRTIGVAVRQILLKR
jgi:hypothetical protein